MKVSYCYSWNGLLLAPRDPYDKDTARAHHHSGALYTVLLGDPYAPQTVIQIRLEVPAIGVHFLDSRLRLQVRYSFGWPEGDRLFLDEYQRFEFADDGGKKSSERVTFQKDGLLHVSDVDFVTQTTHEYNVMGDVSGNWEPIPAFGDYASIARFERGVAS